MSRDISKDKQANKTLKRHCSIRKRVRPVYLQVVKCNIWSHELCEESLQISENRALSLTGGSFGFSLPCRPIHRNVSKCDLVDESTFNFNDIIPRSTITMTIWPYNGLPTLVRAIVSGDICKLMSILGRSDSAGSSQPLGTSLPSPWHSHSLFPALFVSAHRGKKAVVQFLIANGACVKSWTPQGRNALHAAACQGYTECIDVLVAAGAPVHERDLCGVAAIDAARRAGHRSSVRLLSLSRWQERTAEVRPRCHLDPSELFAHQHFCSNLRTCLRGPQAQRYVAQMRSRGREPRSQLCPGVTQHGEWHRLHQKHGHLCQGLRATQ